MKLLFFVLLVSGFAGCADQILNEEEKEVFDGNGGVLEPVIQNEPPTLASAAKSAKQLSAAYYSTGIRSQNTQNVASGLVILTAASVVGGAVKGTSDAALANRGIAAVGVQQAASRGVGKTTIESIFDGAQTLNCIGGMATIYAEKANLNNDDVAVEVTLSVIREVRIAVRRGLTREVAKYSDMLAAFKEAIPDGDGGQGKDNKALVEISRATKTDILEYLLRLEGCVSQKSLTKAAKQDEKGQK